MEVLLIYGRGGNKKTPRPVFYTFDFIVLCDKLRSMINIDCDLKVFMADNIPLGNEQPLKEEDKAFTPKENEDQPPTTLVIGEE